MKFLCISENLITIKVDKRCKMDTLLNKIELLVSKCERDYIIALSYKNVSKLSTKYLQKEDIRGFRYCPDDKIYLVFVNEYLME